MKKRTIEIDEDIAFQCREWFWQRVGVAVLALFVLGALFGLTGAGGPLSRGEAGDPSGALRVEYERVVRRGASATVKVHFRSAAPGATQFWVSAPYFEHVKIDVVVPQPDAVAIDQGRHIYTIRVGSTATVTLHPEHLTIGRLAAEIGLVGGPSVRISQVSLF